MNLEEFIINVKKLGIDLNQTQIDQFNKYYELLIEYNKVMNLTGITEYEAVLEKHFYDSLTMCNKVDLNNSTLVDIGAGAGFPCIPLKIAYPTLNITVVDSLTKRMTFLETVIKELGLKDIKCLAKRGEDFAKLHREEFDYVTARAVARLNILDEICLPLVKINGYFIALKGASYQEEIDSAGHAFSKLKAKYTNKFLFELPQNMGERAIIIYKKVDITPNIYPRIYAKIKKNPL